MDELLNAGVKVIQYRHKAPFLRSHWEECRTLASKAHQRGAVFIVNDRVDMAKACGAHGVHLGQEDLPPDKARRFTGQGMYIGFSTHNLEQAQAALQLPVDYIAVGPVFATASKQNPDPIVGVELICSIWSLTDKPVVAIGGITVSNAASVLKAGAAAVAVIGDLLRAPNIEARAREFLKKLADPIEDGAAMRY